MYVYLNSYAQIGIYSISRNFEPKHLHIYILRTFDYTLNIRVPWMCI